MRDQEAPFRARSALSSPAAATPPAPRGRAGRSGGSERGKVSSDFRVTLRIPAELAGKVAALARAEGLSVSRAYVEIVRRAMAPREVPFVDSGDSGGPDRLRPGVDVGSPGVGAIPAGYTESPGSPGSPADSVDEGGAAALGSVLGLAGPVSDGPTPDSEVALAAAVDPNAGPPADSLAALGPHRFGALAPALPFPVRAVLGTALVFVVLFFFRFSVQPASPTLGSYVFDRWTQSLWHCHPRAGAGGSEALCVPFRWSGAP